MSFPGGVGIWGSPPDILNQLNNFASRSISSFSSQILLLTAVIILVVRDLPEQAFKQTQGRKSSPMPLFLHNGNNASYLTDATNSSRWRVDHTNLWGRLLSFGSWRNMYGLKLIVLFIQTRIQAGLKLTCVSKAYRMASSALPVALFYLICPHMVAGFIFPVWFRVSFKFRFMFF